MTFFNKIQQSLDGLSGSKKKVAFYLMDQWLEASFLSASQLAKNAKVSESVVVRYSQDLGYTGFPDLQKDLQNILKSRLVSPGKDLVNSVEIEKKEIDKDVDEDLDLMYKQAIFNLNNSLLVNSTKTYFDIIEKIENAKNIVIISRKNSLGPAHILNVHLNELFSNSRVMNGESTETLDVIKGLSKEDLVIFITIPSYSKRMIEFSDFIIERKINQIAITDTTSNRIAENSLFKLITSVESLSFSNSHMATVFLIDVLFYLMTLKKQPETLKLIEDMKILNERFNIAD